jgi:DNA invertase Pin-like site-specific DNA recombinase
MSDATAVLFAAKSTADTHGSIGTQLSDTRAAAESDGREVVREFSDEAFSAFSGNRGPGLAEAMAECERLVAEHGEAALYVQHSDRLARGDGRQAKHLVEYALWALKNDVRICSVQDPQTFGDLLYAVVTGQRNTEDSKRKGLATAAGQRRRFERGKRLGGPLPDGFRLVPVLDGEGTPIIDSTGQAERDVAIDPERGKVWLRIFDLAEAGHTTGQIASLLNNEGSRRQRGTPWTTRAIRNGLRNDWYCGHAHAYGETIRDDHPALIPEERWQRLQTLARYAQGTRRPRTDAAKEYLLRSLLTCADCGQRLYPRELADGRHYVCRGYRELGICEQSYIAAEPLERAVLNHLENFIGSLDAWLAGRVKEADKDREQFAEALEAQQKELRKLRLRAERAQGQYERLLDEGDPLADTALRKAGEFDKDASNLADTIRHGEQHLDSWPVPDVDAALDVYGRLQDAIRGRMSGVQEVTDLNRALRASIAEAQVAVRDGKLHAAFRLLATDAVENGELPLALEMEDGQITFATRNLPVVSGATP